MSDPGTWRPRSRQTVNAIDPNTPVADLNDADDAGRSALLLLSDQQRHTLAWRMEQDVWLREQLRRRGQQRTLWDRRWVRISTVFAILGAFATFLYAIIQVLAALHQVAGH